MNIKITNESSYSNLSQDHKDICTLVIEKYKQILSTNLYNIRLMGSVPRGNFRDFYSDIDFIAITHNSIQKSTITKLEETAQALSTNFPKIRKIDMEVLCKNGISDFRNLVFKTDSISIYSTDLYTERFAEIDSKVLASCTTPNLTTLIDEYRTGINTTKDEKKLKQFSLWIGKDILKAFRKRLILEKGIYEVSAKKIHAALIENYKEDESVFNELLECYLNPLTDATELNKILDSVEGIKHKYLPLT